MLKISLGIFGDFISRVVLINYLSHRLLLEIKQAILSMEARLTYSLFGAAVPGDDVTLSLLN